MITRRSSRRARCARRVRRLARSVLRSAPVWRVRSIPVVERLLETAPGLWARAVVREQLARPPVPMAQRGPAGAGLTAAGVPVAAGDARSDGSITTRFVVLGAPRSGTNLLVFELGRRWSEIRSGSEMFRVRQAEGHSVEETIEEVFHADTGQPIVGCKIFTGHVTEAELQRILALPGMRVVILRRHNDLRRYVSAAIAQVEGKWVLPRGALRASAAERSVVVEPSAYRADRRRLAAQYRQFEALSRGLPVLQLTYEELSADPDRAVRRVATFLGAGPPTRGGPPSLSRQNPEPLRQLIRNYDEVRAMAVEYGLTHFLDAEEDRPPTPPHETTTAAAPCWPTPGQELLLHLALDPGPVDIEALRRWEDAVDEHGAITLDPGSARLLPLLDRRLPPGAVVPMLAGAIHDRQIEARRNNLVLLHELAGVLDRLHAAGIDTLVLKGAALACGYYRNVGDRPMHDLDVLVRPDRVVAAVDALRADGWVFGELPGDTRVARLLDSHHALSLVRGPVELDLHWYSLLEAMGSELDGTLWSAAVPLDVRGRATRALAPADQVLHAIVHGLRWNPVPTIRWVADCHAVITAAGPSLDWERLATLADRHRLAAPVKAAVAYLERHFPGLVPADAAARVAALSVGGAEQRAFEHGLRPHGTLGTVATRWYQYRQRTPRCSVPLGMAGFVRDSARHYDLDHVGQLPGRVARAAVAQRRRRRARSER